MNGLWLWAWTSWGGESEWPAMKPQRKRGRKLAFELKIYSILKISELFGDKTKLFET